MKKTDILLAILGAGIPAIDEVLKGKIDARPASDFPQKKKGLTLHHNRNTGMMMEVGKENQILSTVIPTAVLTAFFANAVLSEETPSVLNKTGTALLAGGALSNLYDRFTRGYVVDYFSFHLKPIRHVVFNLGDLAIFSGIMAIFFDSLKQD